MSQTILTTLGKETILTNLAGQNIEYNILKTPKTPAYPAGDEVKYSDDYISKLNKVYPINEILGEQITDLAQGIGITKYVMRSPLKNFEAETELTYMLMNSAMAKSWQPRIIDMSHLKDTDMKTTEEYLERIEVANNFGEADELYGLKVINDNNFALIKEHENKIIVIPSQLLIEYIAQRK